MVRLKEKRDLQTEHSSSVFQFLMVRLKDQCQTCLCPLTMQFQFLMVRLKAALAIFVLSPYFISIPYGAIKRAASEADILNESVFQFLMVRLKVSAGKQPAWINYNFNSLWCD